jgi:hypothetical protein
MKKPHDCRILARTSTEDTDYVIDDVSVGNMARQEAPRSGSNRKLNIRALLAYKVQRMPCLL